MILSVSRWYINGCFKEYRLTHRAYNLHCFIGKPRKARE